MQLLFAEQRTGIQRLDLLIPVLKLQTVCLLPSTEVTLCGYGLQFSPKVGPCSGPLGALQIHVPFTQTVLELCWVVKSSEAACTQNLFIPWYEGKRAAWSWAVFSSSVLPGAARLYLGHARPAHFSELAKAYQKTVTEVVLPGLQDMTALICLSK